MTCTECSKHLINSSQSNRSGNIIADTRPGRADIYLDGEVVIDPSGKIAKTPTIIRNVSEGMHTVTFSKSGYSDITILANVSQWNDYHAKALLNTSMFSYPMMLSEELQQLQPSPGWPYLPIKQVTYGHLVASTVPDGAEIYIDGEPVLDINGNIATTPSSVTGIVTGVHIVTFKLAGYTDEDVTVYIENGLYSDARAILQPVVDNT